MKQIVFPNGTTVVQNNDEFIVVLNDKRQFISDSLKDALRDAVFFELTDEDTRAYHEGKITHNVEQILEILWNLGFQELHIWGVKEPKDLTESPLFVNVVE